jgi:hypothetical protein
VIKKRKSDVASLGSIPELNGNKIGRTLLKNCNLVIVWWPRGACVLNVTNLV